MNPRTWLPFEMPLVELEERLAQLQSSDGEQHPERAQEIASLQQALEEKKREIFSNLSTWEKVQLARHLKRPYTLDFVGEICDDFVELFGDRLYGDDAAMVAGLGTIDGLPVGIVGHQKGRTTAERQRRSFGMSNPEGYRKALRIMKMAEKLGIPVVAFIDTPAAQCLEDAEARGISRSIALNMMDMFLLKIPIVIAIIGEGGSGGAIGIGVGDRIIMLEYAFYSVIPPESCASIIWRDADQKEKAAEALKLDAPSALELGVADEIVPEPLGGAHRDAVTTAANLKQAILRALEELRAVPVDRLLEQRYEKFRRMGKFIDTGEPAVEGTAGGGGAKAPQSLP